jgi:hypothetical protein
MGDYIMVVMSTFLYNRLLNNKKENEKKKKVNLKHMVFITTKLIQSIKRKFELN